LSLRLAIAVAGVVMRLLAAVTAQRTWQQGRATIGAHLRVAHNRPHARRQSGQSAGMTSGERNRYSVERSRLAGTFHH